MIIPMNTLILFCISLVFTTVLPISLLVILSLKKKISPIPMLVGVGAFFLSQIILRIPLMSIFSTMGWYQSFAQNYSIIYIILVGGLTAGLFEETARLGGAKLLKSNTSYKDAISFGLGHALCEVIMLNGMTNVNNVLLSLQINSGNSEIIAAYTANGILQSLTSATPMLIALGLLERLPAIVFHIFATLLVFKGVNEHKIYYYLLAILAHTILNSASALVMNYFGIIASEVVLLLFGIAMLVCIFTLKPNFKAVQNSVVR